MNISFTSRYRYFLLLLALLLPCSSLYAAEQQDAKATSAQPPIEHSATQHAKELIASYCQRGQKHHSQSDYMGALNSYNDADRIAESAYRNEEQDPIIVEIDHLRSQVYRDLRQYRQAITWATNALDAYKTSYYDEKHPAVVQVLHTLSTIYDQQGDYGLATCCAQEAIEMMEALCKGNTMWEEILVYLQQKAVPSIEDFKQWCIHEECREEAIWEDISDSEQSTIRHLYPTIYTTLDALLQGNNLRNQPYHPTIADLLETQAIAFHHLGNSEKALQKHQTALLIRQLAYPDNPSHPKRLQSHAHIAMVYHQQGKQFQQEATKREAVQRQLLHLGKKEIAYTLCAKEVQQKQQAAEEAFQKAFHHLDTAIEYWKKAHKEEQQLHPTIALLYDTLGQLQSTLGDHEKALTSIAQSR